MKFAPSFRWAPIVLAGCFAACSGDPVQDGEVTSAPPENQNNQLLSETPLAEAPEGAVDLVRLRNGPQVLFVPRHSVPMVSCTVLIPAGSALETPATNGAAHYLEHLLFNRTVSRTREEI